MSQKSILCCLLLIFLAATVSAADLYQVRVKSAAEADLLTAAGIEPVARLNDGYLVLADQAAARNLAGVKMMLQPVAADIEKQNLAVDLRLDRKNTERFPLIFEEGDFRLYRVEAGMSPDQLASLSLMPIRSDLTRIEFTPPPALKSSAAARVDGLQELIDQISQDSLESYTSRLQAFRNRLTGSDSNYASRDWIASKFVEFGYDSIAIDSFIANSTQCQNVVAYKIGDYLPEHHVIIGAHRDAVSGSPGADDNGSGTAAVLEMARILKDIPTDLSFVFILFDGEEQGLNGSYHYAEEANARGDSIVYMLNLDMIAHYQNSTQAKLYHGTDQTYSLLWQELADSLVGISGTLMGNSGGSDHYPFSQYGYKVTFAHEYIFSTVYHSYQDSTTYMNFEYMRRMVQASLATAYSVSQTYIPGPSLTFDYPGDVPEVLVPDQATAFEVVVNGFYDGVPVPGTGQIHYSINGGVEQTEAMTVLMGNRYTATLPALACGDYIHFYVSAEEATVGTVYDPSPSQPYLAFPATTDSIVFFDDFESDRGWVISGGLWARGTPIGGGGVYGGPDPTSGYNSPSVFGYNLNGDYTSGMPERNITSPPIDCSGKFGTRLSFQRWLGVEQPSYDHAYVRVSNNGINWTTIWTNTVEVADYDWVYMEFDISALADNQPTVYVRFTMGITDGSWNYCGWNVDDVTVRAFQCESGPGPLNIATDDLPDWTAGFQFAEQLTATGGVGAYSWVDKYGDLTGTGLALSSAGLLSGLPAAAGNISFTAEVSDEASGLDQMVYDFNINDSLIIVTDALPSAVVGEVYEHQLVCSGGTGLIFWHDLNDGLAGTGLSMASNGVVAGTPMSAGEISFAAVAGDSIGCSIEKPFSLVVMAPYTCGDANGDSDVNVADAVFIINYVFKSGPPPDPYCTGDANGDGDANVADAVYLINFVFSGGPPAVEGCCM